MRGVALWIVILELRRPDENHGRAHRAVVGPAILGGRRALGKDTGDILGAGAAAVGDGHRGRRLRGPGLINPGSPNSEVSALVRLSGDFAHLNRTFLLLSKSQEEELGGRDGQTMGRRGEMK